MKNRLHSQDFKLEYIDDFKYQYFCWSNENYEICIEPVGSTYDVCIYDQNGIIIGDRNRLIPVEGEHTTQRFLRAVEVANDLYKTHVFTEKALTAC